MKNTPFVKFHEGLNAKMVEFAGYNMPVSYTSINIEHEAVRNGVGVFDVSHMGEFFISGPKSFSLIQKVTSNDISILNPGRAQYNCLPNLQNGIVDDLIVYKIDEEKYMLVVNASNMEKDWNWIQSHNTENALMENKSDDFALLAVQGPKAQSVLQKLTDIDLNSIGFYHFKTGSLAGVDDVIISATGYTGSGGFELYFDRKYADKVWPAIFEAGKEYDIQAIGLGARDTLRLEMGFCLYGNDINNTTSPLEAGLGWITKFTEGNDFINRAALEQQKAEGLKRKLIGFEMIDRGIARHDYIIKDGDNNILGQVTSGTQSPSLKKAIGMGYVANGFWKPGTEIFIEIRNKSLKAIVVRPPFYKPN
jgi:glycine cleavage system T protein (aminomethyltransferase)